jgi:TonB dependent receptor.
LLPVWPWQPSGKASIWWCYGREQPGLKCISRHGQA